MTLISFVSYVAVFRECCSQCRLIKFTWSSHILPL